ncbi:MAG TPA: hypothetical protein VF736_00360, partial [Pyrinomonadaceae bacterium]
MGPRGRETFVSPTDETVPLEDERALRPPRFDEKSVQRAQPAVPLGRRGRGRPWPLAVIVLCVLGGLAGGVLGGLALTLFQRGEHRAEPQARESQPSPAPRDSQATAAGAAADGAGPQTAAAQPADGAAAPAPSAQQEAAESAQGAEP